MIDEEGFRHGVGIILINDSDQLFWGRRVGIRGGWQFPQGGRKEHETYDEAMFRELTEEIGITQKDVSILSRTTELLSYRLPDNLIRHHDHPICIGQKQRWYLLRMLGNDEIFDFNMTDVPEFDSFRWVSYWYPLKRVIDFKKEVYRRALEEFSNIALN